MHTLVPVLSTFRRLGVLPGGCWTVGTAFSGGETLMQAISQLEPPQPAELRFASESAPDCRALVSAVHGSGFSFPSDSRSPAATILAPQAMLVMWGFPCNVWSTAHRGVTDAEMEDALSVFEKAMAYWQVCTILFVWRCRMFHALLLHVGRAPYRASVLAGERPKLVLPFSRLGSRASHDGPLFFGWHHLRGRALSH